MREPERHQPYAVRAAAIHQFVTDYCNAHGYSPSIEEIAEEIGMQKPATHTVLRKMLDEGLVTMIPNSPRTIRAVAGANLVAPSEVL